MKSLLRKTLLELVKVLTAAALSAVGLYCSGCVQYTDGAPVISFGSFGGESSMEKK